MDAGADRVGEGRGEGGAEESDVGGVMGGVARHVLGVPLARRLDDEDEVRDRAGGGPARPDARRAASSSTCASDGEGCANTPDPYPNA